MKLAERLSEEKQDCFLSPRWCLASLDSNVKSRIVKSLVGFTAKEMGTNESAHLFYLSGEPILGSEGMNPMWKKF